jgi:Asp-tRNA(Asn)/Glu-tRNA(Gln) amidotransferase C subunit
MLRAAFDRHRLVLAALPRHRLASSGAAISNAVRRAFPEKPTWSIGELRESSPPELPEEQLTYVARLSRLSVPADAEERRQLRQQLGAILATAQKVTSGDLAADTEDQPLGTPVAASMAGNAAEILASLQSGHEAAASPASADDRQACGQSDVPAASSRLRRDTAEHSVLTPAELLEAAPAAEAPYFAVPKVIGDVAEEG